MYLRNGFYFVARTISLVGYILLSVRDLCGVEVGLSAGKTMFAENR